MFFYSHTEVTAKLVNNNIRKNWFSSYKLGAFSQWGAISLQWEQEE